MKAPEYLRKPQNWQDFEKLCLKLWGAIWNKPEEIESNSTNEQGQDGVDIFCWVDSENGHIGIQCKCKKEEKIDGKENRITLAEIKKEIELAENFEPKLKRYIIATTAEKDGEIQKEVRKIDAERRLQGKFPVEIKFWDYISNKIDEHKQVHDWYVKSINFKQNQSVNFTFKDGSEQNTVLPLFQKVIKTYHQTFPLRSRNIFIVDGPYDIGNKINKSFVAVQFKIINSGNVPLENWKIKIRIEGECKEIKETNEIDDFGISQFFNKSLDFKIKNNNEILLLPNNSILVGGDEYLFLDFFIKPFNEQPSKIDFNWELLSNDFQDKGKLTLNLEPKIEIKNYNIGTEDPLLARKPPIYGEIEDHIGPKD